MSVCIFLFLSHLTLFENARRLFAWPICGWEACVDVQRLRRVYLMVRGGVMKRKGGGDRRGEDGIRMYNYDALSAFYFIWKKYINFVTRMVHANHPPSHRSKQRGGEGVREIKPPSQPPAHLDPTTLSNAYKHVKRCVKLIFCPRTHEKKNERWLWRSALLYKLWRRGFVSTQHLACTCFHENGSLLQQTPHGMQKQSEVNRRRRRLSPCAHCSSSLSKM